MKSSSLLFERFNLGVWRSRFPGLLLSLLLAIAAHYLGRIWPLIGAPVFAIVLGVVYRVFIGLGDTLPVGVSFTSKKMLQLSIILLGAGLNIHTVVATGAQSFLVMIGTLILALLAGQGVGRLMKLPANLVSLIAVGTGICGASAISSLAPIVGAEEDEIAYSISTIFFFNIVAVFVFPLLGHLLYFSDQVFGLWAGTAINDTSSVVAAAYSYSPAAGQYATIVKLARAIMIIPVCFVFLLFSYTKRKAGQREKSVTFPVFILGFLAMSVLASLGLLGKTGGQQVSQAGQFMIGIALAAVGLGTDLQAIVRTGYRPLLLGLLTWILVACSSLVLQKISGQW